MTDLLEPSNDGPLADRDVPIQDFGRHEEKTLPRPVSEAAQNTDAPHSDTVSNTRTAGPGPEQVGHVGSNSILMQARRDIINNYGKILRDTSVSVDLAAVQNCFAPMAAETSAKIDVIWQQSRLLVIIGEQHVGKRSIALHVLSERLPEALLLSVRELLPDWEKPDAGMLPRNRNQVFLLDLGDVSAEELPSRFGKELHDYVVDTPSARLIVTMTMAAWRRCGGGVDGVSVSVSPASAREVVVRHLRNKGSSRTEWLNDQTIGGLLTDRTLPRDAARLATVIEHAPAVDAAVSVDEQAGASAMPSVETVARIVDEYRSWREYLRGFFSNDENGVTDRALLLSMALLEGAAPAVVWRGAMLLLDGSALAKGAGELLAGPDLDTQLARIVGTEPSDVTETVSLDMVRHGLGAAVLPHVWQQRSPIQKSLISWIRAVSAKDGPGSDRLPAVGRRLAELAAAVSNFDLIETLLTWLDSTPERRVLVADLLGDIAEQDSVLGAAVRGKMWASAYAYSTRENNSARRAELAAQICAGKFMRAYPNATLIRLKWLLAGPNSVTIEQLAGDTLRRMSSVDAESDAVGVLQAVLGWRADSAVAASRGFLALLDPEQPSSPFRTLLLHAAHDETFEAQLQNGWRLATEQQETEDQAVGVLQKWAVAMDRDSDIYEPVLNLVFWLFSRNLRSSLLDKIFDVEQKDAVWSVPTQNLMRAIVRRYAG